MSKHERTADSDIEKALKKRKIKLSSEALFTLMQIDDAKTRTLRAEEFIRAATKMSFSSLNMKDLRDKKLVPSDQDRLIIDLLPTTTLFPEVDFKTCRLPLSFHARSVSLHAYYCALQVYGLPMDQKIEASVVRLYEPIITHRCVLAAVHIAYQFRIIQCDCLIVIVEMKTFFSEENLAQMLGELSAMGTQSGKHGVKKVYGMLIEKTNVYIFEMDVDRHDELIRGSKFEAPTPFSTAPKIGAGGNGQRTMESMQDFADMLFTILMLGLAEYFKSEHLASQAEMKVIMDKFKVDTEKEREEALHLLGACLERFDAPFWSRSEAQAHRRVPFPAGLSAKEFEQRLHEMWKRNGEILEDATE
ncbi:hypothetical protein BT96DRAFT_1016169 [Gymnopus androsaceus JB14]|uniref:Uncharacterized protein n=1 Tax=Gymnopus androsaceus JB14 TaxID=1447944 RepID=A0A6A4I1E9_9AGAR|nr:hypothetical protein BT96DRAFT_1016169 [Gymnopus androsaceus JB14]